MDGAPRIPSETFPRDYHDLLLYLHDPRAIRVRSLVRVEGQRILTPSFDPEAGQNVDRAV
jgi:hypothetical protein